MQFLKAKRIDPFDPTPYYDLGSVYEKFGRLDAAADSYKKALRLKPDDPDSAAALLRLKGRWRLTVLPRNEDFRAQSDVDPSMRESPAASPVAPRGRNRRVRSYSLRLSHKFGKEAEAYREPARRLPAE